jgi:hypothetical protein
MTHRERALTLLNVVSASRPSQKTPREMEQDRLDLEVAKVHVLLAIEERLGYIQNRIGRLDKEV